MFWGFFVTLAIFGILWRQAHRCFKKDLGHQLRQGEWMDVWGPRYPAIPGHGGRATRTEITCLVVYARYGTFVILWNLGFKTIYIILYVYIYIQYIHIIVLCVCLRHDDTKFNVRQVSCPRRRGWTMGRYGKRRGIWFVASRHCFVPLQDMVLLAVCPRG